MAYPTPHPHDATTEAEAEESSWLVRTAVEDAAPALSFGHDEGVATTKKQYGGIPRVAVVVATGFVLATLVVLDPGRRSRRHHRGAPEATTMWHHDLMVVGVHEDEHVHGVHCCPKEHNTCTSQSPAGSICCPDDIYDHYTQWVFGGCVRDSCFACADGLNCCHQNQLGSRDASCPGCDVRCFECLTGETCCHTFQGAWDYTCPNCGTSF